MRPILVVRDGIGLVDGALGGVGIARIYDLSAGAYIADGSLETVLPGWSCGRETVYAVFPGRRHVPAKVSALLEFAGTFLHRITQSRSR